MKCECCNKEFTDTRGLPFHLATQHRHINQKCYDFYIQKYGSEQNFPWKHKIKIIKKCEYCNREFRSRSGLAYHVTTIKNCYEYYIRKYKTKDNFPWKDYSENQLKDLKFQTCECCNKKFKSIIFHLRKYSKRCYDFYIKKYGDEQNFPEGIVHKLGKCKECGKIIGDENQLYCWNCKFTKHHHMHEDLDIIKKIHQKLRKYYDDPLYRKKMSEIYKEYLKKHPEKNEKQKQYMLNGGAIKALVGNSNVSKPQLEFYQKVLIVDKTAIINYPIFEINCLLDIAISSLKLNFEFDGSYWHQNKKLDQDRDEKLKKLGWQVNRFEDRIPSKEEIKIIIEQRKRFLNDTICL